MGGSVNLGQLAWSYKCIDGTEGGEAFRHLSSGRCHDNDMTDKLLYLN
jgi:hypothetical protein